MCYSTTVNNLLWNLHDTFSPQLLNSHDFLSFSSRCWTILTCYWITYCKKYLFSKGDIFTLFCYKFIQLTACKKLIYYTSGWLSYCKNNRGAFFMPHSVRCCVMLQSVGVIVVIGRHQQLFPASGVCTASSARGRRLFNSHGATAPCQRYGACDAIRCDKL